MTETPIYFKQLEIGPMQNFIYLIGDPHLKEAAVVDPAWEVDKILAVAEKDGYQIRHVLVTHGHPDHINGVEEVLTRTQARLHMHGAEIPWMPGWKSSSTPSEHGSKLKIGDVEITFIHTPGHTPGSQCFLVQSRLVSGDTLFVNSCGRTDLPGGDSAKLYDSLTQRILKLKDSTVLFPGHNYAEQTSATIAQQKKTNPVLKCENLNAFLQMFGPSVIGNY